MAISVFDVANYFLCKSIPGTEYAITHLKLQKLVYYAQAWHYTITDRPLFDEEIEAWVHGPVIPKLYHVYKSYGYDEIPAEVVKPSLKPPSNEILDDVWEAYGSFSGGFLEQQTHKEAPWKNARGKLDDREYSNEIITLDSMKMYYGSFVGDN